MPAMNLPANTTSNPCSWTTPACAAALAAVCLAVYGRLCGYDFVGNDDYLHVYQNPYLSPLSWSGLAYLWRHPYEQLYIPVAYTGFALLCLLSRGPHMERFTDTGSPYNPHVFHTANVILHIVNALFVFFLLRRIVKKDVPALAGSLLFALHPLQVESVAWVSEFRGQFSAALGFVSLALYIRAWDIIIAVGDPPPRRTQWIGLGVFTAAFGFFVLSLLAKPTAVVYPVLFPLIDSLIHRRSLRQYIQEFAPWAVVSLVFISVTRTDQFVMPQAFTAPYYRPLIACDALNFYLKKFLLPTNLAIDYGRIPRVVLSSPHALQMWFIPPLLIALAMWLGRRKPWANVSVAIPLVVLAPNLGLIPFAFQYYSTVTDRYAYLAMIGPAIAAATLVGRIRVKWAMIAPALVLAVWAGLSTTRCADWKDTITIMMRELRVNPLSTIALIDVGNYYQDRGDHPFALRCYRLSIHERPNLWRGYYNAAVSYMALGKIRPAVDMYLQTMQYNGDFADAHLGLANAFIEQRRYAAALPEIQTAVQSDKRLSMTHYARARAYMGMKQYDKALIELNRQIVEDDSVPGPFACKGIVLRELGDRARAQQAFGRGKDLAETDAAWYGELGEAESLADRFADARRHLQLSLRLSPNEPVAKRTLVSVDKALARQSRGLPPNEE